MSRGRRPPLGPNTIPLLIVASVLAVVPWLGLAWAALLASPPGSSTSESCSGAVLCFDLGTPRGVVTSWLWPSVVCVVIAAATALGVARHTGVRGWPGVIVVVGLAAIGVYAWYLS